MRDISNRLPNTTKMPSRSYPHLRAFLVSTKKARGVII